MSHYTRRLKHSVRRDAAEPIQGKGLDAARRLQLRKEAGAAGFRLGSKMLSPDHAPVQSKSETIQRKADGTLDVAATAAHGFEGGGGGMPHAERIQASFGRHDVGSVQAYSGSAAADACSTLGASAYASGDSVAFRASPDLHTAAHEAAHVVQQRAGVQLKDGVGRPGDRYESHADKVADAVVQGRSAQGLLDEMAGGPAAGVQKKEAPVQKLGHGLDKPLPADAEQPAHGAHKDQRKYSVEQYVAMWEKERGRKMTAAEKKTLARGCIGITALNIGAVNPPLNHAYATFEQAMAVVKEWNAFIEKHKGETLSNGQKVGNYKAFLFAKLFWSNQDADPDKRKKADPKAYKPDPKTGKVDMTGYKYRAQPGYVNFDYGFWDQDSQTFWHANHCQPGMIVYQSTREKFAKGYIDFDRIVYCAAIAKVYDPQASARNNG